ncbi:hypothetical protein MG293_006443 [Ovis ammon polii]|uniref:Uncharacterized protein n=1 Tax=Ovis ammon polii TaxID=230172 RepID=A0AAD4UH36_OVIAM|nr:hypothetical protein MG293_006443 [Ovis ammon polii]
MRALLCAAPPLGGSPIALFFLSCHPPAAVVITVPLVTPLVSTLTLAGTLTLMVNSILKSGDQGALKELPRDLAGIDLAYDLQAAGKGLNARVPRGFC